MMLGESTIYENTREGLRNISLSDKFLEERCIFLNGEIHEDVALSVVQQLLYLDSVSDEPIKLYLNTPGGCCISGLYIMDIMESLRSPVYTIAAGECCSMGFAILVRGDKRFSLPSTEIMAHQCSAGAMGNIQDMRITFKRLEELNDLLAYKISEAMGMTFEDYKKRTIRDWWMGAEDALRYNVIDEICTPQPAKGKRIFKY